VSNSNAIDLTTVQNILNWLSMGQGGKAVIPAELQSIQDCITAASSYWLWSLGFGPSGGGAPTQSSLNSAVQFSDIYDGPGSDRLFIRVRPVLSVSSLSVNGLAIPASSGPTVPGYVIDSSGKSISIRSGFGGPANGQLRVGFGFLRNGGYWNFGQGSQNVQVNYTAGYAAATISNELQTIPASTALITVNLQPWFSDLGVTFFVGGAALVKVLTAPAAGQYNLQPGGQYLFNSADMGKQVQISYTATGVPYDIEMAVRQMVAVNYKRRSWIDQSSQMMANGAGSIAFRSWEMPPEVASVMEQYRRRALV
jgi:hypothetical protein